MTHYSERYDFSYWPPMPIEHGPLIPAQSTQADELCNGMLYIADDAKRRAVYATGEWADIVDFWLESDPPKEDQVHTYGADEALRVSSARHLSGPTYAFNCLAYEMAYREADHMGIDPDDHNAQSQTDTYRFLVGKALNPQATGCSRRYILIARQAIVDIYDNRDSLPLGAGKTSMRYLAKVALRWSDVMASLDTMSLRDD